MGLVLCLVLRSSSQKLLTGPTIPSCKLWRDGQSDQRFASHESCRSFFAHAKSSDSRSRRHRHPAYSRRVYKSQRPRAFTANSTTLTEKTGTAGGLCTSRRSHDCRSSLGSIERVELQYPLSKLQQQVVRFQAPAFAPRRSPLRLYQPHLFRTRFFRFGCNCKVSLSEFSNQTAALSSYLLSARSSALNHLFSPGPVKRTRAISIGSIKAMTVEIVLSGRRFIMHTSATAIIRASWPEVFSVPERFSRNDRATVSPLSNCPADVV